MKTTGMLVLLLCFQTYAYAQGTESILDDYTKKIYLQLKHSNLFGVNEWVLGDVYSDDAVAGGDYGGSDQPDIQAISRYSLDAGNRHFLQYWSGNYAVINFCNTALGIIDAFAPEDTFRIEKARFKFFRALCYFNLLKVFGDLPLYIEPFQVETMDKPRTPAGGIWLQIESDLGAASSGLPLLRDTEEKYHPTKRSAAALLVKTFIYQQKWNEAVLAAEELIESGIYDLHPDFKTNFSLQGDYGIESLFEIEQLDDPPASDSPYPTNVHNVFLNPRNVFVNGVSVRYPGWGFDCPTQSLLNAFEEGDPRLKYSISQKGDSLPYEIIDEDTLWVLIDADTASPTHMYSRKYEVHPFENTAGNADFQPKNIKVIRYADVLLWAAEAALNLNDTARALGYINQVRTRARNSGSSGIPADLTSVSMLDIIHERRIELALEGHRYFDLQRYHNNGYIDIQQVVEASGKEGTENFYGQTHILFPIPPSVICSSQGLTGQNPGYYSETDTAFLEKDPVIVIDLNTGNPDIFLYHYFGCSPAAVQTSFSIEKYTKHALREVELSYWQMILTFRDYVSAMDTISVIVDCGCPRRFDLQLDITGITSKANPANKDDDLWVFPNPAVNHLLINGLKSESTIRLYTLTGEKTEEIVAGDNPCVIKIDHLSPGFYILKITSEELALTMKIIKN